MTPASNILRDILAPGDIAVKLDAPTKKNLLQSVADLAGGSLKRDPHTVFDVLWEREKLGTTGVGTGIAIPHGRLEGLTQVFGLFARLAQPVAYDSIDEKPVDLVFLLLAPQNAGADHLQALAAVSKLLREPKLCAELRAAPDAAAIYRLLTETMVAAA